MSRPELPVEVVAKLTHEVNRAYCKAALDDASQPAWAEAPDWQKRSAVNGVIATIRGQIETPEDSHASWFAEKERDGWVYGPVKDPEAKTHPCMVPYNELPAEQRTKDYLFQAIVRTAMCEFDLVSVG